MNLYDSPFATYLAGLVQSPSDAGAPFAPRGTYAVLGSELPGRIVTIVNGVAADRQDRLSTHNYVISVTVQSATFNGDALIVRSCERPGARVNWHLVRSGDFGTAPIKMYATPAQAVFGMSGTIVDVSRTAGVSIAPMSVTVNTVFLKTAVSIIEASVERVRTTPTPTPTTTCAPMRVARGEMSAVRTRLPEPLCEIPSTLAPPPRTLRGGAPGSPGDKGDKGDRGEQGEQGEMGLTEGSFASYTSDHPGTLTRGMAVCVIGGMLRRATSLTSASSKCIGFVYEDALLQGEVGRIQTDGNFVTTALMWDDATSMLGGLASGSMYYLTATGAIQPFYPTTSGSYLAPVGVALDSTTLRIEINPTILL
jgi:hypothetical protein